MAQVKIHFNTQFESAESRDLKWRVLVNGDEVLARSVSIEVPCVTTEDLLPIGITKWHITCEGTVRISEDHVIIN
jgi:hypothetical protein